jgi:hypothetical protein
LRERAKGRTQLYTQTASYINTRESGDEEDHTATTVVQKNIKAGNFDDDSELSIIT